MCGMSSSGRISVRRATLSETPLVVDILARAFADDPFFHWLVVQDDEVEARRRAIFEAFVAGLGFPRGEVWIAEGAGGAAIWHHPGRWRAGWLTQLRLMPRFVNAAGLAAGWPKFIALNSLERRHPKEPHYYLFTVGVVPEDQGRGYGRALLAPLLDLCESQGMPGYLETAKESNIAIYERYGFRVLTRFNLPFGGPTVWTMWRDGASR